MRDNEYKKHPFNPSEKVGTIIAVVILSIVWLATLILGYKITGNF